MGLETDQAVAPLMGGGRLDHDAVDRDKVVGNAGEGGQTGRDRCSSSHCGPGPTCYCKKGAFTPFGCQLLIAYTMTATMDQVRVIEKCIFN